jgi:hypothetical protein
MVALHLRGFFNNPLTGGKDDKVVKGLLNFHSGVFDGLRRTGIR